MTSKPVSLLAVIPVRNDAARIGGAITSLLQQTLPPSRILVVDDGSRDDLAGALAPFGDAVSCLTLPPTGAVAARNRGFADGSETYIASLDSDDSYHPERLARAVAAMAADPDLMGTVCMAQNRRADGQPVGEPLAAYTLGALVARRALFERIGYPDASLNHGAGLDWFVRAREANMQIALDPEPLLNRLLRSDSFSHSARGASHAEHLSVVRAALKRQREG